MRHLTSWFALTVCLWAFPLHAHAFKDDLQLWAPVVLEQPVKKWRVGLEVQPRLADNWRNLSVVRVRPFIAYDPNKHVSLIAGYFWSPLFPAYGESGPTQYENRLWQQVVLDHPLTPSGKGELAHQFRLEQRFLPTTSETSIRGRYMTRALWPLDKNKRWTLVASNEIHVNLNSVPGLPGGFLQDRIFAGVRHQLTKAVFVESGYMLQLVNEPGPKRDQANHILLLRVQATLPRWIDKALSKKGEPQKPQDDPSYLPFILD